MKDHEWCDMNDEMDFYLSRCLKNWAAESQPPRAARARLLRAASSPPVQGERMLSRFYSFIRTFIPYGEERLEEYHDGWVLAPYHQPRVWSFYFAASWRMAN